MTLILRVYDKDMVLRHVLNCAAQLSYELKRNDLSVCSFALPHDDAAALQLQAHDFVRIVDGSRDVGVYRIISWEGGGKGPESFEVYQCEHVIATLLDSVMDGDHLMGGADMGTRAVAEHILSYQTTPHWQLGACDFDDHYEYAISSSDLLTALWSLGNVLVDDYQWVTDTTGYPWVISLCRASDKVTAGLTYRRNLIGLTRSVDASKLITRLYPKGNGEGVNQLTIASVNGGLPYIDAPPEIIDRYRIKAAEYPVSDIEDPALLLAKGRQVLALLCQPVYTYEAEAAGIYRYTGLAWDDIHEGALIRVYDAEDGIDLVTRVVSLRKEDMGGDPARMLVTLSTAGTDLLSDINSLADRMAIAELYSQGTTQMYPLQLADNADPEHPLVLRYYVPPEAKHINKVICAWQLEPFRAHSRGLIAGGGEASTTEFGGSSNITSSVIVDVTTRVFETTLAGEAIYTWDEELTTHSEGSHYHSIPREVTADVNYTDTAGSHAHTLPAHRHYAPHDHVAESVVVVPPLEVVIPEHQHTMSIPSHSHGIQYGIFEGSTASSVVIRVDGTEIPADIISGGQADVAAYLEADDDGKIRRGVWHTIEIVPDKLTRIVGNLYMQIFIQHRGGGSY